MLSFSLVAQLALLGASTASVTQTCVWKDGTVAKDFLPCGNSTVSTGSCCLNGETCLASGLCYGGLGVLYRGACLNDWGSGDCPTFCDGISSVWSNIYPCPFADSGSAYGPQNFWCGPLGTTVCTGNANSTFITISPGLATKVLTTAPTSSSSVTSSTATSSGTTTAASNANNAQPSASAGASESSNGTAIGLGIGLGVLVLALIGVGAWAYRSNRKQKAQFEVLNEAMMQKQSPNIQPSPETSNYSTYNGQGVGTPASGKPENSNYSSYGGHGISPPVPNQNAPTYSNYNTHGGELDSLVPPSEMDAGRAELGGR